MRTGTIAHWDMIITQVLVSTHNYLHTHNIVRFVSSWRVLSLKDYDNLLSHINIFSSLTAGRFLLQSMPITVTVMANMRSIIPPI